LRRDGGRIGFKNQAREKMKRGRRKTDSRGMYEGPNQKGREKALSRPWGGGQQERVERRATVLK